MIGFFTPRYVKDGEAMRHAVRKMLCYKRDLMQPAEVQMVEDKLVRLKEALRSRNREGVEQITKELDEFFGKRFPIPANPEVRENVEVLLVAIVIAFAIRSYFLQPFTIPTGSMQPTLNGIIVTATQELPPNPLVRALDMARYGRSYFHVVSKEDDKVVSVTDESWLWFFSYARIECEKQPPLYIPAPARSVAEVFHLEPRRDQERNIIYRRLKAGEVMAGYADTGDHVFVNKMAYNFRKPQRGEVFVFSTANISAIATPDGNSQYYIKRLAGLPGDTLRIDAPKLFINGQLAAEPPFQRVMAGTEHHPVDGYRGYSNHPDYGIPFLFLNNPESTFLVREKNYFALGDNSYNSADSRAWGTVPEENLMGYGMFVYWPFTKHWGFIK